LTALRFPGEHCVSRGALRFLGEHCVSWGSTAFPGGAQRFLGEHSVFRGSSAFPGGALRFPGEHCLSWGSTAFPGGALTLALRLSAAVTLTFEQNYRLGLWKPYIGGIMTLSKRCIIKDRTYCVEDYCKTCEAGNFIFIFGLLIPTKIYGKKTTKSQS